MKTVGSIMGADSDRSDSGVAGGPPRQAGGSRFETLVGTGVGDALFVRHGIAAHHSGRHALPVEGSPHCLASHPGHGRTLSKPGKASATGSRPPASKDAGQEAERKIAIAPGYGHGRLLRPIEGYPGYQFSRPGEVQSCWSRHARRSRMTEAWLPLARHAAPGAT